MIKHPVTTIQSKNLTIGTYENSKIDALALGY